MATRFLLGCTRLCAVVSFLAYLAAFLLRAKDRQFAYAAVDGVMASVMAVAVRILFSLSEEA